MKISTFIPPYNAKGRANYPTESKPGCYLIRENGVLVYIGMSATNVYKTMYRHFQRWPDRQQLLITYRDRLKKNHYTVRVVYCTAKQAQALERLLIIKHKPRDNDFKYSQYTLNLYDKQVKDIYNDTDPCPF